MPHDTGSDTLTDAGSPDPRDTYEHDNGYARAINAQPWDPLPGMVKRCCDRCAFYFATQADAQLSLCPQCTIAQRRRQHGGPLRIVERKQASD